MLRSNIKIEEQSDFNIIKDESHIDKVWPTLEENITKYFEQMLNSEVGIEELKSNTSFKVKSSSGAIRDKLAEIFGNGLSYYENECVKYRDFFSEDSMLEFDDEDDPKAFKSALSTKVPVIRKARNSKRPLMRDWQERFATSKAVDIYSIFFNVIDFKNDYVKGIDILEFSEYDSIDEFSALSILNDDDDYNVPGVIGMGIKSSVLFYLNPALFLGENKNTLYGFYFLSNYDHFNLASKTNEFVMINDLKDNTQRGSKTNNIIDQNYWYPYDLFMLYAIRTYRKLKELCASHKYNLDDNYRFVHVNSFMSEIWKIRYDEIITMTGGDQESEI